MNLTHRSLPMTRQTTHSTPVALATLASAIAAVALASPSFACSTGRVDVYDRTASEALHTYRHRGKQYVVGTPGNEYAVRVRNCTGQRVLAVVSVDGVNVVTGETAAPDQAGYVIEPYGYVNIQGWRKDLDRTAAFYFSDPADSYATRTGRPDNLGVIGVALFREKMRLAVASPEGKMTDEAAAREAAAAPRMESSLGTGHGRREHSRVERVAFERSSDTPDQRIAIRYERREALVSMGVLPRTPRWSEPDPFPATLGFVPDP
jgi:hypothetical protein